MNWDLAISSFEIGHTGITEKREIFSLGMPPKPKGRPRKDGEAAKQDVQKELERLRMENKLLRDFLRFAERM